MWTEDYGNPPLTFICPKCGSHHFNYPRTQAWKDELASREDCFLCHRENKIIAKQEIGE